jgi:hypothetical protein
VPEIVAPELQSYDLIMQQRPSLATAFRMNIAPALVLWCVASLMLALYYTVSSVEDALNVLAEVKARLGLFFVMPAQAVAAGLMPYVFQKLQRDTEPRIHLSQLPYLMVFWAFLGALTNAFYDVQAHIFGDNAALQTIALKTAVDMLLYTPLLSMPLIILAYAYKDAGFSSMKIRQNLGLDWYWSRVLPVYRASLLVWTPTLCVLYALPLALQFPMQAIVQCFWGLILVIMTRHETCSSSSGEAVHASGT